MRIEDWPIWAKLTAGGAAIAMVAGLATNLEAIAESPLQPFVFKYQIAGVVEALNSIQLQATKKGLSDFRSQRLMLKESIERETDADDRREKMLRLESIESDITEGEADYKKLRCRIDKAAACP